MRIRLLLFIMVVLNVIRLVDDLCNMILVRIRYIVLLLLLLVLMGRLVDINIVLIMVNVMVLFMRNLDIKEILLDLLFISLRKGELVGMRL